MNPSEFAAKWSESTAKESAGAKEHFIDLCQMLGVETPNADPTGERYAFEKGAEKTEGGDGFADVWKRGHFAWEYKGKKKDLKAAYKQLLDYREALENPPLLVVCDLDRFEVHTNFTNTVKQIHAFTLDDLAMSPKEPLRILRAVMGDPEQLRPKKTPEELTEQAAREFAKLALTLRDRGHDPQAVAHFLDKLLFCLFAEDAGLLPAGLLGRLADATRTDPADFTAQLSDLFGRMSSKGGGFFGAERVEWFNGSLFDGSDVFPLQKAEIDTIRTVAKLDWAEIEPAIFGTLFERGLDPDRRTQLGAHYTDRDSIDRLVEPVLMTPLRREFERMKTDVLAMLARGKTTYRMSRAPSELERRVNEFLDRLRTITVLDPACGSGNFLYIALQKLKDLEREALLWASLTLKLPMQFPQVGPHQLKGIEINPYAAELTRVTIWIGEIQWMLRNGFAYLRNPILRPLDNIETKDALIDWTDLDHPREATWPDADVIIGNPPFLGGKVMRTGLGDRYVDDLFKVYDGRVPREADFATYWHEKARSKIEARTTQRAGLLANQSIRSGASRRVLRRIKETGGLFFARADVPWVLAGAKVHVSFVGQDDGSDGERTLDGASVTEINPDLTAGIDLTRAVRLPENSGIAFMGDTKGGPFELAPAVAYPMLDAHNPDGRSNRDVLRPWVNGEDLHGRKRDKWIIDFGTSMSRAEAALFQAPFEYVREHVRPHREVSRSTIDAWWLHERPRGDMRRALSKLSRYIATTRVSPHRLFVWLSPDVLPDSRLIVYARDDDYFFGVLQSRAHEAWSRRTSGAQRREALSGFTYTPTTSFETFPFPRPSDAQKHAIAEAAARLDVLRTGWLDPPEAEPEELEARTLTNLYNERPGWLSDIHALLDQAVFAAYGWSAAMSADEVAAALLALNLERARGSVPTSLDLGA